MAIKVFAWSFRFCKKDIPVTITAFKGSVTCQNVIVTDGDSDDKPSLVFGDTNMIILIIVIPVVLD